MPQLDYVLYNIFLCSAFTFSAVILCLVTEALLLVTLLQRGRRQRSTLEPVFCHGCTTGGAGFQRSGDFCLYWKSVTPFTYSTAQLYVEALNIDLVKCWHTFLQNPTNRSTFGWRQQVLGFIFSSFFSCAFTQGYAVEAAIFPILGHLQQKQTYGVDKITFDLKQKELTQFLKPGTHRQSTGVVEDALARVFGKNTAHDIALVKEDFVISQFLQQQQALKDAEAFRLAEAATQLENAYLAQEAAQMTAIRLAESRSQLETARLAQELSRLENACLAEEALDLDLIRLNKVLSQLEDARLAEEAAQLMAKHFARANANAVKDFVRQVLNDQDVNSVLDYLADDRPKFSVFLKEAFSSLEQFGSDGLFSELLVDNPEFWLGAAVTTVARSLLYFCEVVTVANPQGLKQMPLANHLTHYDSFLQRLSPSSLSQLTVAPGNLLSLGLESLWNAQLSGQRLEQALQQVRQAHSVYPSENISWLTQGFGPGLLQQISLLNQIPPEDLNLFSQMLLMRGPESAAYHWGGSEVWIQQLNPLGEYLFDLLNHPSVRPGGLVPVNMEEVWFLSNYLLENRAMRHQLPQDILEFNTGWQQLIWADVVHQAATTLWLEQLAVMDPVIAGKYALSPELRQVVAAATQSRWD